MMDDEDAITSHKRKASDSDPPEHETKKRKTEVQSEQSEKPTSQSEESGKSTSQSEEDVIVL